MLCRGAAWYTANSITDASLCWAEGEPEWLPLQNIPQLQEAVQHGPVAAQTASSADPVQQPAGEQPNCQSCIPVLLESLCTLALNVIQQSLSVLQSASALRTAF